MSSSVHIVSYTDKSVVVIGDTKSHKDSLKSLGGKWNASLTNRETGEKFMGWIFYINKQKEVQSWIDKGCPPIEGGESESKQDFARPQAMGIVDTENRIRKLEKTVEMLLSKVSTLELELKGKKEEYEYEEVEEAPVKPQRRLLRR